MTMKYFSFELLNVLLYPGDAILLFIFHCSSQSIAVHWAAAVSKEPYPASDAYTLDDVLFVCVVI